MPRMILLLPVMACVTLILIVTPARADTCSVESAAENSGLASSVQFEGECLAHPDSEPAAPATVGVVEESVERPVWALEPLWGVHGETGEPCVELVESSEVTVNEPLGLVWEARMLQMLHDPRLESVEFRWCAASSASLVADPSAVARSFVRSIPLPEPELWVAPGWALTGMDAYLEIGGQQGFAVESSVADFGVLEVSLVPSWVVVEWGDGTVERVDDGRLGAPFDGPVEEQISHVYVDADEGSRVSVDVGWEALWHVAGFSGVVDDLQVSAALDLPVETRRAVRTAPDHAP